MATFGPRRGEEPALTPANRRAIPPVDMQRVEQPPNADAWRDRGRCNRARRTHDPAYDGVFFTCVRTTRIYCRSICPSGHARARNVFFVPSAAAAERLGFRPCLRCRPRAAPPVASVHEACRRHPGRRGWHATRAGREATSQRYKPAARRHRLRSRLQECPALQRRVPKDLPASALELPARDDLAAVSAWPRGSSASRGASSTRFSAGMTEQKT